MALKFFGAEDQGTSSDALLAMEYALAHGAHVVRARKGGLICFPPFLSFPPSLP